MAINHRVEPLEERAAAIVRAARLPRGKYGVSLPSGRVDLHRTATDAVWYALATQKRQRLYRLNSGWRFVGEITEDGTFIDQRVGR